MGDGHLDELVGQRLEFLAVGDGGGQGGGVLGRDPLSDVIFFAPDLMFEIGAGLGPGRMLTIFGFETALFHGLQRSHLFKQGGPLDMEFGLHWPKYV